MPAERQRTIHDIWLHDDTEEDLVGADWHQRAIVNLYAGLVDLATQRSWPWHVGNQLPLVGWKRDGTSWRPSPDIMIHPQAGPALREEMSVRDDGPPALIIEVASATTWRYDVDRARNVAHTTSADGRHTWAVPLAPFLGCLGVAPANGESRTSIVPGNFGGNMDCWEVRAGNTVFLGVNMPGALLSFGDGHYAMGEGEIMGAAIEGAMNVDMYVELLKHRATPVPRIENADEIMFVGSGRPLEDAARVAFKAMVEWVQRATGLSAIDAYQFVSQNARAPIIQLVDPEYTVLVKLAKARLPARST